MSRAESTHESHRTKGREEKSVGPLQRGRWLAAKHPLRDSCRSIGPTASASITLFIKPRRTTAAKREREKPRSNVRRSVRQPEEAAFVAFRHRSRENFDRLKINHSLRSIFSYLAFVLSPVQFPRSKISTFKILKWREGEGGGNSVQLTSAYRVERWVHSFFINVYISENVVEILEGRRRYAYAIFFRVNSSVNFHV